MVGALMMGGMTKSFVDRHNSKLERNMKLLRHFWQSEREVCDCGCRERIYVKGWVCLNKLNEMLNEQGYKVVKK